MTVTTEPPIRAPLTASLAIDNLRAVVILLVVAFHSALAYLDFLPHHPFAFDAPPFMWRSFPIVDNERWVGFDLFCAWLDVFLMSFFFLLSGLFVWPSLRRRGAGGFLFGRVVRLGLPFVVIVLLVMPVAHYPSYLQSVGASDPGFAAFGRHWLNLPLWPAGPMWFLWLLLIGDAIAAGRCLLMRRQGERLLHLASWARRRPGWFLVGFALAAACAYLPLALAFGPAQWIQRGPFSFQLSRPLHYLLYFLAGAAIGAGGIERGFAAASGPLPPRWRGWLIAAAMLFAVWLGLTDWVMKAGGRAPLALRVADDLSFSAACFSSCMFVLAAALTFGRRRWRVPASLKDNAYGIYLVHYVFVVWLQYALLAAAWPAVAKGAAVFAVSLILSWSASLALQRIGVVARIIGAGRRTPAGSQPSGRGAAAAKQFAR